MKFTGEIEKKSIADGFNFDPPHRSRDADGERNGFTTVVRRAGYERVGITVAPISRERDLHVRKY